MAVAGLRRLAFILLLCTGRASGGELRVEQMPFDGQTRSYAVYAPARPDDAGPAPLLLVLHGSYGNGAPMVKRWQALADEHGFVVAGPDASAPAHWRTPEDCPEFVYAVTRKLREQHAIDARRLYLFGYSAGGKIALTLAMLESEYYAATAVYGAAWRSPDEVVAMELSRRKMPFALIAGQQDPSAPPEALRFTRQVLGRAGFPVQVTVVPRHGHRYDDIADRVNAWAWEFLQQQRLEREPRHFRYGEPAGRQ